MIKKSQIASTSKGKSKAHDSDSPMVEKEYVFLHFHLQFFSY